MALPQPERRMDVPAITDTFRWLAGGHLQPPGKLETHEATKFHKVPEQCSSNPMGKMALQRHERRTKVAAIIAAFMRLKDNSVTRKVMAADSQLILRNVQIDRLDISEYQEQPVPTYMILYENKVKVRVECGATDTRN